MKSWSIDDSPNWRLLSAVIITLLPLMGLVGLVSQIPSISNYQSSPWPHIAALIAFSILAVIHWVLYFRSYIDAQIKAAFGKDSSRSIEIEEREGGIGRYPKAH